ncbi:MAG: hypothetical protein AAGH40_01815 [Verrucomicrobiota bacterium]
MPEGTKYPFRTFLEPTFCLAVITAILYFWGFVYFATFCEQLDVGFHGIEVPFTNYLLVGWQHILWITLFLCVALCWYEQARWLLSKIVKGILGWLFKRWHGFFEKLFNSRWLKWIDEDEPKSELLKIGLILVATTGCAIYGTHNLVNQAQAFADDQLEAKRAIILHDANHEPIDGDFIYLMDYGSALIVGELKEDKVDRIRIFKAGSYTSYSLEKANETAQAETK